MISPGHSTLINAFRPCEELKSKKAVLLLASELFMIFYSRADLKSIVQS